MLAKLTGDGVKTVKSNPERILEVNQEVEQFGAKVLQQFATIGQWDFVSIVEAPDERAIARISMELSARGTVRYESLPAIPIQEFIGLL
jgi:uncharacterized protein with GYD domain